MTEDRTVIRSISWRDLFPWLILLRTFRIAVSPQLLVAATAATLLTSLGWWISGWVFLHHYDEAAKEWVVQGPKVMETSLERQMPAAVQEYLPGAPTGLFEPFYRLAEPVRQLFSWRLSFVETAYYVFGSLWALAAWSLAGGYITRHAVVELATESSPGLKGPATFALRRYLWYLLTPLYPLLGIVLIGAVIALVGLPMRFAPGLGTILAGLLWIFVVLGSLAAVWLIVGLLFGWPLMWPAVSAERDGDPFEAFSRSFSYVYGAPLHYLFYVVVAALFGAVCLAVVVGVGTLVTEFGFWALAWGGGSENVERTRTLVELVLANQDRELSSEANKTWVFGATIMALVVGLVRAVVRGYTFSFFWCVASAIYLLLRRDVDEQEMDEVYQEPRPVTPAPATTASPAPQQPETPAADAPPPTEELGSNG